MRSWNPAAIVNPRAGSGRAVSLWKKEQARLEARFGRIETRETLHPGHASELACELRATGYDLLIVAGGDGTLNEIANGLLAEDSPAGDITLAPLPAGNGSDLARALASHGEPRPLDAVRVACRDVRGSQLTRWFVNMASFGLGAEVVRRAGERSRMGYLFAAASTLRSYRARPVRLTVDGSIAEFCAVHVAIGNGCSQGGGMRLCPRALLDDGMIDVTAIGDVGLFDLVANLRLIYSGRIHDHSKVSHFRGTSFAAEADAALELDGDLVGCLPAEFAIRPGALSIVRV